MPAQNLHLALLPYIKKHKASCAALCKAMREKKLAIHLYLDESTGPNAAWSYCNNSDWHFLITSDGARLVSKFTWCGTYSFGSRGGAAKCKGVYEQTTGKKWEDLSEGAQFLASQAVSAYIEAHEIDLENDPQYWEAAEWLCQYDIEVEDFLTGNYDEGELFEENLDELNQLCAGMREIMDKYNSRLGRALKTALTAVLARYEGMVYTEDRLADAKADKKELSRLHQDIDDRRKEIKKAYLAPYQNFEAQIKELLAMVDAPLEEIKSFVSEMEVREKESKRREIEAYFFQRSASLGTLAGQVLNSPAFFEAKWLNKSTSAKTWQAAVDEKIAKAAWNLKSIETSAGPHAGAVTAKYLETLSTEGLAEYRSQLAAVSALEPPAAPVSTDRRQGSLTLRLTGGTEELAQVMEVLSMLGVDCEVLEDNRSQPMPELTRPDFDSFVCFDLETSGTYGAANGDGPAEITEIGAVRVVKGEITETFSQLVNPGRKILPRIARITHITDEMVADQPGPEEAVRLFADFVGDSVLVGHNIRQSDLHYIDAAARRAGIRLENPFFDTYRFARTLKEAQGWENVKLEYLSEVFGIAQPEAHRAWCDAQANALLYEKLKELAR